ncbi:Clp protease ClpP [Enterococcus hulanensis]|uniref:head maturation protease, ClpP-related n=1 Tax=Enterococcus hulanensis TaxID=2559929 RepID=UPI00289011F9|nr:head maturation protease, ClpP-related [Enterococcus hulanensis]MDT2660696.1 Clp protease ClpP [Enterococcus hulanensis]
MVKISIKGDIVDNDTAWLYEWLGMECVSPNSVLNTLSEADGEEVELEIASAGGDVLAASEIYTALRAYQGKVVGDVVSLAASAASVIACACDPLRISPTAHIMIHNSWLTSSGNKDDKQQDMTLLANIDESIINAYEAKSKQPRDELSKLMKEETWMNAQTAMEKGFADEIMFDEPVQIANSGTQMIPKAAVSKLKNVVLNNEKPKTKEESLTQKKLNALRGGK